MVTETVPDSEVAWVADSQAAGPANCQVEGAGHHLHGCSTIQQHQQHQQQQAKGDYHSGHFEQVPHSSEQGNSQRQDQGAYDSDVQESQQLQSL